ncbi:MAG: hypothetical protein JHC95_11245 [Solirubrobacteraceae bacterium]|nr:hypothetical protein [Solirubrobacteraceae bacterium]
MSDGSITSHDDRALDDPTWLSCLVVVAAYDDLARVASSAAAKVTAGAGLSPELADFLEVRFAALGPRPDDPDVCAAAAAALVEAALYPGAVAPVNYLGVVIVDDVAASLEAVLTTCAERFETLGMHAELTGIAMLRSRDSAPASDVADIVSLETGPKRGQRLAREIVGVGERLMETFGAGDLPGLSPAEIDALRDAAEPEELPEPDDDPETEDEAELDEHEHDHGDDAAPPRTEPAVVAPVYVALVGDLDTRWRRARRLLCEFDAHLAEMSSERLGLEFKVGLVGLGPSAMGPLRPAGQVRRRDVRRPVGFADFGGQLTALGAAFSRGARPQGAPDGYVTRPSVVLLAGEPPPADVFATARFRELSAQANVLWVLLGDPLLLSVAYRDGAVVLTDHAEIIEETFEHVVAGYTAGSSRDSVRDG